METLRIRLKEVREDQGLPMAAMADLLQVTRQTWWNWEMGHTMPNIEGLEKLQRLADVDVNWLIRTDQ